MLPLTPPRTQQHTFMRKKERQITNKSRFETSRTGGWAQIPVRADANGFGLSRCATTTSAPFISLTHWWLFTISPNCCAVGVSVCPSFALSRHCAVIKIAGMRSTRSAHGLNGCHMYIKLFSLSLFPYVLSHPLTITQASKRMARKHNEINETQIWWPDTGQGEKESVKDNPLPSHPRHPIISGSSFWNRFWCVFCYFSFTAFGVDDELRLSLKLGMQKIPAESPPWRLRKKVH